MAFGLNATKGKKLVKRRKKVHGSTHRRQRYCWLKKAVLVHMRTKQPPTNFPLADGKHIFPSAFRTPTIPANKNPVRRCRLGMEHGSSLKRIKSRVFN